MTPEDGRVIARRAARLRPRPTDDLPDDDMEEWRAWQDMDLEERLRRIEDPLP